MTGARPLSSSRPCLSPTDVLPLHHPSTDSLLSVTRNRIDPQPRLCALYLDGMDTTGPGQPVRVSPPSPFSPSHRPLQSPPLAHCRRRPCPPYNTPDLGSTFQLHCLFIQRRTGWLMLICAVRLPITSFGWQPIPRLMTTPPISPPRVLLPGDRTDLLDRSRSGHTYNDINKTIMLYI